MELRNLRVFVEVVRQGGFTQAAKTVCATQSTVSKAIKQLEDEFGVPLLERVGRRSNLTVAGEVVYRQALNMLATRDDLLAELDEIEGLKRGALRLGVPLLARDTLFAPAFAIYRSRYPGIDIRIFEYGGQRSKEAVLAGEIDLAASLLPVPEEFQWQAIIAEPMVALLPASHPLAGEKSITLADLKSLPFILFEPGFVLHRMIREACRRRGFEPTVVALSSQADFTVELASTGLGVAFLPQRIANAYRRPDLSLILLSEPKTEWRSAMIWRRSGYLPPAAKAWLAIMDEVHGQTERG